VPSSLSAPVPQQDLAALEPVLFRFALRAVRDRDLAHDLTQDALLVAVADRGTFAGRSALRTWVVGILSHKIMDHFRRAAVRTVDATPDDAVLLATPSDEDIERVVAARQELASVDRALQSLPERERMALLLVDVEGLDREESCSALGVSATHLRVLLHRGRNRLRGLLEHGT
jgi:RNA polymerase sigma factor (sigma-70 family)